MIFKIHAFTKEDILRTVSKFILPSRHLFSTVEKKKYFLKTLKLNKLLNFDCLISTLLSLKSSIKLNTIITVTGIKHFQTDLKRI